MQAASRKRFGSDENEGGVPLVRALLAADVVSLLQMGLRPRLRINSFTMEIYMRTMQGVAGNPVADRHVRQYLNERLLLSNRYVLEKRSCHLQPGAEIDIAFVEVVDGVYHAHTVCGHLVPITKLRKPKVGRAAINPEQAEDEQIRVLQESINKFKTPSTLEIWVKVGSHRIPVERVEKVTALGANGKKPKADFVLIDMIGVPQLYGSLKAGPDPRQFQQWGGVTNIGWHETVQTFTDRLKARGIDPKESFPKKCSVSMDLDPDNADDVDLMRMMMFGSEASNRWGGHIDSVNVIIGGQPIIEEVNKVLTFTAPLIIENNTYFNAWDHPAEIIARYGEGRSNLGFKNCRVGVFPKGSRKVHVKV